MLGLNCRSAVTIKLQGDVFEVTDCDLKHHRSDGRSSMPQEIAAIPKIYFIFPVALYSLKCV